MTNSAEVKPGRCLGRYPPSAVRHCAPLLEVERRTRSPQTQINSTPPSNRRARCHGMATGVSNRSHMTVTTESDNSSSRGDSALRKSRTRSRAESSRRRDSLSCLMVPRLRRTSSWSRHRTSNDSNSASKAACIHRTIERTSADSHWFSRLPVIRRT